MQHLVILGAGTGGALISNMLSQQMDLTKWQITIIDKASQHVYQPGLLLIPFGLYGYDDGQDLVKDITTPLPRNVTFVRADIQLIDHEQKSVKTDQGLHPYDILVCALGCQIAPEEIERLEDKLGEQVFTFYTLEQAEKLRVALDSVRSGRMVLNICDMPIKCPVAPIEFMFLADYYFHLKGIRNRIELIFVTPLAGAFTKPNANRALTEIARRKGIQVIPNFNLAAVDTEANCIKSFEGATINYDLLVTIPPNVGPKVIDVSGLGDGNGYALTDPRTLKSKRAEHIYFIGDNTNVATSKAGSVAHFEAETVVKNILREIDGKPPLASYDGHANCFIESGHHKALLIDFNYDMEPLSGDYPLPYAGPFSLLQESYLNHMGKMTFKWIYWNMLLPGRLSHVPLLPSHMSILGKDLTSTTQVRNAQLLHVSDVMSKNIVTIIQGSSLNEAATLMTKQHLSGLPVLDVEEHLVGILTEGDFLAAMDADGAGLTGPLEIMLRRYRTRKHMGTIVDDIMTRNPITIKPDDVLQTAITLMERNRVKRLVVTDNQGKVAGIISRADLMKLFTLK
jgi:sulfide:quinone oxidoreductase